ncbi:hypothetical protein [Dawidia soli]|uniref:Uncharacterized protein n=1 Tax=Dawidia soli TaxID=2782352 RepID=A0AAP2DA83_9BACT|nr:hypothetical protein [Dawidia soli]MBT1688306.1 hypothetical protein [Dawidia soli]
MTTVFIPHLFLTLASLLPEPPAADNKLPDGYYRGTGFMLAVFVRVSGDTAFVELVDWQKYPRHVIVDTVYHQRQHDAWDGKYLALAADGKKLFIRQNKQSPQNLIGEDTKFRIKPQGQFYGKKVDPRNSAMINQYYLTFLKKHPTPEERLLYYQTLYHMVDKRADHSMFQWQFEKYRATLEKKIAAPGN